MTDANVGKPDPAISRYKCMEIFLRPATMIQDPRGNWVSAGSPGKTNCILPKGHEDVDVPYHMNIRGECTDGEQRDPRKEIDRVLTGQAKQRKA